MSLDESCSIEVAVRVRPMNAREEEQGVLPIINASEERKEVTIVRGGGNRQTRQTYTFDHVFTGYTTQSEVFDPMQPMIDSVMQGYEATVFAYGQTGTGKTHTMEGDVMDPNEKGVIPRSVEAIFDRLGHKDKYSEFSVSASYLEIYNEELTDLLVELPVTLKKAPVKPPPAGDKTPREHKLEVVEDKGTVTKPGRGMFVHGLSEHTVSQSAVETPRVGPAPQASAPQPRTVALEAQLENRRQPAWPSTPREAPLEDEPALSPPAGVELERRAAADPARAGAAAGAGDQDEHGVEPLALRLHAERLLQVADRRRAGRVLGQAAHG
tara:strand:- start:17 stop:991 length:975 start_codon:yes stop_codon:yes gene_type:complete